jgi:UDP-N-acetylglucosamine acyltransferase
MSNVPPKIHPTTVLDGDVQIDEGVEIGPYCLIQGKVKIGKGTFIEGHVSIGYRYGEVEIGENNHFSPGAVIGGPPQDVGYKNERTRLKIGNHNLFREFSTANIATTKGDFETTIGSHGYFMAYTHIGHDCKISDHVIIANNSHLGGHTVLEDHVVVGGQCGFNQFTKVGRFAFIAGGSVVNKDIMPFARAHGDHAVCRATNKVGLARNGFNKEEVENVHKALRIMIMGSGTVEEGLERIQKECVPSPNIQYLLDFVRGSKRGIAR